MKYKNTMRTTHNKMEALESYVDIARRTYRSSMSPQASREELQLTLGT